MDLMLVAGGAVIWVALLVFALALGTVAGRADRLQERAVRQGEALRQLSRMRSPSGKPFFPTQRHQRQLLRSGGGARQGRHAAAASRGRAVAGCPVTLGSGRSWRPVSLMRCGSAQDPHKEARCDAA